MPNRVRVNLANPAELLELPGIGPEQARAILRFRAEHGNSFRGREKSKRRRNHFIARAGAASHQRQLQRGRAAVHADTKSRAEIIGEGFFEGRHFRSHNE